MKETNNRMLLHAALICLVLAVSFFVPRWAAALLCTWSGFAAGLLGFRHSGRNRCEVCKKIGIRPAAGTHIMSNGMLVCPQHAAIGKSLGYEPRKPLSVSRNRPLGVAEGELE